MHYLFEKMYHINPTNPAKDQALMNQLLEKCAFFKNKK